MSSRLPLFQVDAFAARHFEGNPAAVLLREGFACKRAVGNPTQD